MDGVSLVAVVTGASSGVGFEVALGLGRAGKHHVILAVESDEVGMATMERLGQRLAEEGREAGSYEIMLLDLGNAASISDFATLFSKRYDYLQLLVLGQNVLARGYSETAMGLERSFALNHVGQATLTHLLLPRMRPLADARVVLLASSMYVYSGPLVLTHLTEKRALTHMGLIEGLFQYMRTRLCNLLFFNSLAHQLASEGSSIAVHAADVPPALADVGDVGTALYPWLIAPLLRFVQASAQEAAEAPLKLALDADYAHGHAFLVNGEATELNEDAVDLEAAEALSNFCQSTTGISYVPYRPPSRFSPRSSPRRTSSRSSLPSPKRSRA